MIEKIKIKFTDRRTKAQFVFEKYKRILRGDILDVGADQGYLEQYLPNDCNYTGLGFSDKDFIINIDLEKEKIPFQDNSFDTVLCLDVLEHLENIHDVFDGLCRLSRNWIIISLPNPWKDFMNCIQKSKYKPDRNIKFYGLTKSREDDRHKWFFSPTEASEFVKYRAEKNGYSLFDVFIEDEKNDGMFTPKSFKDKLRYMFIKKARKMMFRSDLNFLDLYQGAQWYVLKKDTR